MVSERLSVYLHISLAGYLWLSDTNRYSFQYDPDYLENPEAIPLSLSLPMREAPYTNDTARPFFSNLLPEGEVRSLIAHIGIQRAEDDSENLRYYKDPYHACKNLPLD